MLEKGADHPGLRDRHDAFRYEAAQELTGNNSMVSIVSMRSYPHSSACCPHIPGWYGRAAAAQGFDYAENGTIRIDSLSCGSLEQRG